MSFQQSLKQIQTLLQTELITFFGKKRKEAKKMHPELVSMVNQIADLTLRGGKRIRPFLCWMGYQIMLNAKCQMLNNKTREDKMLIETMVALELFHSFALIHDDIIDQDEKRRGGDTINNYFTKESLKPACRRGRFKFKSLKLANHFGMSMAILAGDLALSWADELMIKTGGLYTSEVRLRLRHTSEVRLMKTYQKMKEQMILGQSLDVLKQFGFADISQDKVNELKTAWYSVVWPLTIGALLANASQKDIFNLQRYGLLVGQAFQLRDDFMDQNITKKDFILQTKEYKRNVEKAINAFPADDQRRKLMSDVAAFVVTRNS